MIGIIDYGMGNLRSVEKAFLHIGFHAVIVKTPSAILDCEKLVLPGVGAFGDAIATIQKIELDAAIKRTVAEGRPFLGICLGMQLLFDSSEENGFHEGLRLLPGKIVRVRDRSESGEILKIPHMGWNSLDIIKKEPLFAEPPRPHVYFDHAYCLQTDADIVSATCSYGQTLQIAVQSGLVFGLQFHPEKSGETGLAILKRFGGLR